MPLIPKKALIYSIYLWLTGFVWGTIVFMVPLLKDIPSLPYFSKFPAISFPILFAYALLLWIWSNSYLKYAGGGTLEALKFGIFIFVLNLLLDLIVYRVFFTDESYFNYFSIWLSYLIMIVIPLVVSKMREE